MVTARLAIGAVSTLAFGALLLGSAPYWLHRGADGSRATPWGAITALDATRAEAAQSDEQARLLKLAALKSGTPVDPAPVSSIQPDNPPAAQPVAPMDATPVQAAAPATQAPVEQPAPQPQQVASLDASATGEAAQDDGAGKPDRININTASSSALDHLPGAGRIGHTIVSHRPYKTVKDLVSRRVLRTSDFQKIQAHITVD